MKNTYIYSLILVLILSACGTSSAPATADVNAIQTSAMETAWAAFGQTETASAPTNTPIPTNTPAPTNTPIPTNTPNLNLIRPGTYLIGTDINPGLYVGNAGSDISSSCYWARLNSVSGDLSSVLANDNSVGQYYVEILQTDVAFQTNCGLVRLVSLPQPANTFPTTIKRGTYLVGIDIQAGTYRGQAGSEFTDSCYWARLSNAAGGLDAILANDNAVGQYYVQVTATDFALTTRCPLEWVSN